MNDYYAQVIHKLEHQRTVRDVMRHNELMRALRDDADAEPRRPFSRFIGLIARVRIISRRTPHAAVNRAERLA